MSGADYTPARVAENGSFILRYDNIPTSVDPRDGKLLLAYNWTPPGGTATVAQQQRNFVSVTPSTGETLSVLGSPTIYSVYRP